MDTPLPYQLLADAVLVLHFAVVLFVIGGLLVILVGNRRGWRWVNHPVFRWPHLIAIAVVAAQAWFGQLCPLTVLESALRERAGESAYQASFIEHWVQQILYYNAPWWVFTLVYTLFGLAVLITWWRFPPRR